MGIPSVYSIISFKYHTKKYDRIISNASLANRLSQIAKVDLDSEIWKIVAGLMNFGEGNQYVKLTEIREGIVDMIRKKSDTNESIELLIVASRTEKTLENYVHKLETQIAKNASVSENQEVMDQIRGVSSLLDDVLQSFIMDEIKNAEMENELIRKTSRNLLLLQIIIFTVTLGFAFRAGLNLFCSIKRPVAGMESYSSEIAGGNLEARVEVPDIVEFEKLAQNLNTMAVRIKLLIEANIREQKNLQKAEMKTLQAQITPHFLYNTFDTIIWLAESEHIDDVIEMTRAFSNFFRISLSKGHDWITVSQEMEHVRNYLTIQKIRYANILDYEINMQEGLDYVPMLKLILQPLVENAIYHGIKNKRGRGKITVQAVREDAFDLKDGGIKFTVSDNGIGFTEERLASVKKELEMNKDTEELKSVYGLYNVNKRLELYYDKKVALNIESSYGSGTCISFTVPVDVKIKEDENV